MKTGSPSRSTSRTQQMLLRWEPGREMRRIHDMLDRVMDDSVSGANEWYEGLAPIDLCQTQDEIVMEAVMPGVTKVGPSVFNREHREFNVNIKGRTCWYRS